MKRYVIEREMPGVGSLTPQQLREAAAKSNEALAKLGGKAQTRLPELPDTPTIDETVPGVINAGWNGLLAPK
jgi:hypothetical protein